MKRIFKIYKEQEGFSITEMIITIIFIGVALVSLLNTFNVGLRSASDSESISLSTQLAEAKMERIKSDKASFGFSQLIQQNYLQEENPDGYEGYSRTITITNFTNYKKVEVTVSHSKFPSVSLITLFANY